MAKNFPHGLVAAFLPLLIGVPANAQATRTWISGVGDDANPCSRTAPCKTFAGAISKTAAGGEIDVLDPGGFGAVTITKSITLASEGAGEAGILVSGTNGIVIEAGATDFVILRGLQIEGLGTGLSGVRFNSGGTLLIQNCSIRNFNGGAPNGFGILFAPSGASSLMVSDTTVSNNGISSSGGSSGGGIFIQPTGTGSAKATVVRTNVFNNSAGIRADGTQTSGTVSLTVIDSTSSSNALAGMVAVAPGGGGVVKMDISHSMSTNNGTGINANGAAVTMRLSNSVVTGNALGVNIASGATLTSSGNNLIQDNASAGASIPIVSPL